MVLTQLIWPSAGLVVQGVSNAASTAPASRRGPMPNSASRVLGVTARQKVHVQRNALAHAGKAQRRIVAA